MNGKRCFIITGVSLALMGGCAFSDDCTRTGTCSCEDPSFGPSHPEVCSCTDPDYGDAHRDLCSLPDTLDGSTSDATAADGPDVSSLDATAMGEEGGSAGSSGSDASDGGAADVAADVKEEPLPAPCDATKLPSEDACVIDAKYGVFVSPLGNDTNAGTALSPLKTLGRALTAAQGKRVYVCATAGNYDERLNVASAVALFGGFDCTASVWSYARTNVAHVKPSQAGVALTLQGSQRIEMENIAFEVLDATEPGGSSVAAFANQAANVVLRRVTLVAGKGKAGAEVTTTPNYTAAAAPDGNSTTTAMGGAEQSCSALCANGVHATGGKGGDGAAVAPAQSGSDGKPTITPFSPVFATGAGGAGRTAAAQCGVGTDGSNAPPAVAGAGASKWGTLSSAGWAPAAAAPGGVGLPGQGGGGGGGGVFAAGGKGGGGGGACGGCGGAGGPAGNAGGSSFALLSYTSTVTLDSCTLIASTAGDGTKGGDGQGGQLGGTGQNGAVPGCPGGSGGNGAQGGGGGGGTGGLSVAIGYIGTTPAKGIDTFAQAVLRPAMGGAAGLGGSPPASKGQDGVAVPVQDLAP